MLYTSYINLGRKIPLDFIKFKVDFIKFKVDFINIKVDFISIINLANRNILFVEGGTNTLP